MSPIRALVLDGLEQELGHIIDNWMVANSEKLPTGLCHSH